MEVFTVRRHAAYICKQLSHSYIKNARSLICSLLILCWHVCVCLCFCVQDAHLMKDSDGLRLLCIHQTSWIPNLTSSGCLSFFMLSLWLKDSERRVGGGGCLCWLRLKYCCYDFSQMLLQFGHSHLILWLLTVTFKLLFNQWLCLFNLLADVRGNNIISYKYN